MMERMQEVLWMDIWIKEVIENENVQLTLIALGILLLFLLLRKLFITYIYAIILRVSKKSPTELFTYVLTSFEKPLQYIFVIIGLYVAVGFFPYLDQSNELFNQLLKTAFVFSVAYGLLNLAKNTSVLFTKLNDRGKVYLDHTISSFLSKILQFVIAAIAIAIVADIFGFNVNGFVAGLGLGGLAFALAAQDALTNLFGGFVIITEKPFVIDEWIMTPSVEGTVEDISFRSTKIRTFAHALVSVPNATLVNEPITNWSKMGKRQISFNVCITYDTPPDMIKEFVDEMNHFLTNHNEVHQETIFVSTNEYAENGLNIMFYFFSKTTVWGEYLQVREAINLHILELLASKDIEIAVPSRKLYVEEGEKEEEHHQQVVRETNEQ